MKTKISKSAKTLIAFILLLTLILTTSILEVNPIVYAAEDSGSSQSDQSQSQEEPAAAQESSTIDTALLIKSTYDQLKTEYNVGETDKVPAELWLNSEKKSVEKFNSAILSSLSQTSIDGVTVKMLVEDVKNLNLSGLELSEIPDALFYMSKVENLDLSGNNLVVLDFGNAFLFSLNSLNLSGNKTLQSINTFSLQNLKDLNISGCNLRSQSTFSVNKNIESINISNNYIQAVRISGLEKLKDLNISKNSLRFLDLTELLSLEKIDGSENKLSAVNFTKLPALTQLNLSSNFLTSVPDLSSSTSLASGTLNLSNNQILTIPAYLNDMGITPLSGDFSDNLLDSSIFENQKQLVVKDGVKATVSKDFSYQQVLEKLKPYLALQSGKNKDSLQALSPNLGLVILLQDNEDTKEIEQTGIKKDFTASLGFSLTSKSQPEGLATSNSQATLVMSFSSTGDSGLKIEGEPYSLVSPTELTKKAGGTTSTITKEKPSTDSSSSSSGATTQKLPQTGAGDFPRTILVMLIIAVVLSLITLLISLKRKNK